MREIKIAQCGHTITSQVSAQTAGFGKQKLVVSIAKKSGAARHVYLKSILA